MPGIRLCLQAIVVVPDLQQGHLLCPVLVTLLWPSSFDLLLTCHNPSQAPSKKHEYHSVSKLTLDSNMMQEVLITLTLAGGG